MHVILTGGAGYIGSHVAVEALGAGFDVTVIDDFSNSHPESIRRVEEITGKSVQVIEADLAAEGAPELILKKLGTDKVDGAIHLAGLKAVGESVAEPARYYHVNINSALNTIKILEALEAKLFVFSSSATVYGERNQNPVSETGAAYDPTNPYGRTKYFIENIVTDLQISDPDWRVINLRYFNPVGAHASGRIGEDPLGIPNNLFPFIAQVVAGRREALNIFGDDYDTPDGTGVRDYIHVTDLATGHIAALKYLLERREGCAENINLGSGEGYSVLEAVKAFEAAADQPVPYNIVARRDGDVAEIYADPAKAAMLLNWKCQYTLGEMCADHWNWQKQNPDGYKN
jgi:UDP-glucose 4-epimerase